MQSSTAVSTTSSGAPVDSKENFRALLLYFLLVMISNFDSFLLGKYSLLPYADYFDSAFIVNLKLYGELLLEHGLFEWIQPMLGGMPASASLQPPWTLRSVVAGVLPLWLVMPFFKVVAAWLAGYGMFRLLRSYFQTDRRSAFIGGILYILACQWIYVYTWMCYFPLCIVHVDELTSYRTSLFGRLRRLLLFYALTLTSFSVFTLPCFSVGHFLFVLFFDRSGQKCKHLLVVFLLWTGYALTYVPYFLSLYQYVPDVSRVYSMQYTDFWAALASFSGITSYVRDDISMALIIFLLPMVVHSKLLRKGAVYALLPMMLCLFVGSDFYYFLKDSFVVKMDLGHSIQVYYFGAVLFCGLALHEMRKRGIRPNLYWAVGAVLLLRLFCNEAQMIRDGAAMAFALIGVFFIGGDDTTRRRDAAILVGAGACLVFSFLILKQREELKFTHVPFARSFGEYAELERIANEQKDYDFRVACIDLHPASARYLGLDALGTRHVLTNRYYKEYFSRFMLPTFASNARFERFMAQKYDTYTTPREDNRDDLLFESFYPEKKRSIDSWSMPMLLAMGVKYIISPKEIEGIERYAGPPIIDPGVVLPDLLSGGSIEKFYSLPIKIYPVREPFKMATFVSSVRGFPSRQAVLDAMGEAGMADLKSTLYVHDGDVDKTISSTSGSGRVDEVRRKMDTMTVKGEATGPGYVVLSVNYDPRWTCTLNGRAVDIFRANHAFQAIYVDQAGPFEILYRYDDPVVNAGYAGPVIGLVLMLCTLFFSIQPTTVVPSLSSENWLMDFRTAGQRRLLVVGAVGASVVWALGFYFFIYLRYADRAFAPYGYLLFQLTAMGLLLAGWLFFASRDNQ